MRIKIYLPVLFLAVCLWIVSCSDDENNPTEQPELVFVTENVTQSGNYSVMMLAGDTLFEGYNKVYLDIKNESSGQTIEQANVTLFPLMNMTNKKHAAPVENPGSFIGTSGYFEGAVVFIMPSNPDEGWTLDIAFDIDGNNDTAHLVIPVVNSLEEPKKINVISNIDGTVYFVSLIAPTEPTIGVNDLEFAVFYKQDMMNFPPAEDLSITIVPEMPSMDHGSPNNVNPTHTENGHYKGKVNFTMTGWWRVNLTLNNGSGQINNDAYFDITF